MDEKNLKINKILAEAFKNHQRNNLKVAENLYKKILKINPDQFEAIFLLGSLSLQIKDFGTGPEKTITPFWLVSLVIGLLIYLQFTVRGDDFV